MKYILILISVISILLHFFLNIRHVNYMMYSYAIDSIKLKYAFLIVLLTNIITCLILSEKSIFLINIHNYILILIILNFLLYSLYIFVTYYFPPFMFYLPRTYIKSMNSGSVIGAKVLMPFSFTIFCLLFFLNNIILLIMSWISPTK